MDRSSLFLPRRAQWREGGTMANRRGLNTRTYTDRWMSTKTISITEDAYERLRSLKETERMSFSEVILKYYPKRRSLSETLAEIARPQAEDLADQIERTSEKLRTARMRAVDL